MILFVVRLKEVCPFQIFLSYAEANLDPLNPYFDDLVQFRAYYQAYSYWF